MTQGGVALCPACARLRTDGPTSTCEAYPDGIPDGIWLGADHRRPQPGDHGVQFLLMPDDLSATRTLASYAAQNPDGGPDLDPDDHDLPEPIELPEDG